MKDLNPDVVLGMAAQAPDGVVIIDREGLIRYWNHGAERIFGFPAAEVTGRSLDVIIPERHRQRHWDGFQKSMATGSTQYGDDDLLTVPAVGAGGRKLSIEFSVVLLNDADGQPGHVGAVIRDVTARRAKEKELYRQVADAKASQAT
ncbi:PAS domain-containing protein [Streptomyces sp. MI02-7b]|uniref:PAS domain-containing protein n=1 Tax=Streptomyces sp. MI02-7b TaxID=462941 RepID=UPI0029A81297|nr:PAS domain-containing protein [Streptomyces sp. MI02-7b]MDX3078097.1 PAS domain-containing protein [Streptomyces sp. MI02-7b]